MPIKTDRRDAEGIARLLQMGWFRPVHCKSVSAQDMRALLNARKAIQQSTIDLELSLRGVLRNFGLKIGQVGKGRFEVRIRELVEGNPMLEAAANPILRARDPERFRSSKDVGPWAGLTPRRNQSGERDVVGQITLAGDAGLRTALYQAATVMLNRGKPNWLTAWAWKVAQRRGKKRATIGLARRIGVVLHRMWRDGKAFRFTREANTMGAAT